MSRSCHRATFSIRRLRVAAQDPGQAAEPLGEDRVALVGHRRGALLGGAERLLDLAHLGPLEVSDLGREALEPGAGQGDRVANLGVAVPGDHLGGDLLGAQAERVHHPALDRRGHRCVGADGPGELAHPHALERPLEPAQVAFGLEGEAGKAEAEGGRLGVDPVGAPGGERLAVLEGPPDQRVAVVARPGRISSPASRSWSASAVSRTSEDVSP